MGNHDLAIERASRSDIESFNDMHDVDEHVLAIAREAIDEGRQKINRVIHSSMTETY